MPIKPQRWRRLTLPVQLSAAPESPGKAPTAPAQVLDVDEAVYYQNLATTVRSLTLPAMISRPQIVHCPKCAQKIDTQFMPPGLKMPCPRCTADVQIPKSLTCFWKCPKCGGILEKGLGSLFAGAQIVGVATCGGCHAQFPQSDVYGGKYDLKPKGGVSKKWWQFWT